VAGKLPITIMPPPYTVAPGIVLVPKSSGTWGWK
jgi:hypothetical protein